MWLDDVIKTKVYFRDEAFLEMRKNGFLSYLPRPLPFLVARTYDKMYQVNDLQIAVGMGNEYQKSRER